MRIVLEGDVRRVLQILRQLTLTVPDCEIEKLLKSLIDRKVRVILQDGGRVLVEGWTLGVFHVAVELVREAGCRLVSTYPDFQSSFGDSAR